MSFNNRNFILFNAAFGLLIIVGAAVMIKSVVMPDEIQRCSLRYATGTTMSLADDAGVPLTGGALQGALGGSEWGVSDNVTVVSQPAGGDHSLVMQVALTPVAGYDNTEGAGSNGMGFKWQQGYLENQKSACLHYKFKLSEGFQFGQGGVLPGLYAATREGNAGGDEKASFRMVWDRNGKAGMRIGLSAGKEDAVQEVNWRASKLAKNKWVEVEQEVALNTPGRSDGAIRLWVDGELVHEKDGAILRKHPETRLLGVIADTHYERVRGEIGRSKKNFVWMTPFELSW